MEKNMKLSEMVEVIKDVEFTTDESGILRVWNHSSITDRDEKLLGKRFTMLLIEGDIIEEEIKEITKIVEG